MPIPNTIWTPADSAAAVAQGYDLFETLLPECPVEVMLLQRDDDAGIFDDDDDALRHVIMRAGHGDPLALKALYLNNTPVMLDIADDLGIKPGDRPTVIDNAEVFDSEGTLSLQIGDFDVLYLSKCRPEGDDYPKLKGDEHQRIIDVIVSALKLGTPEPTMSGPMTLKRFDLTGRQIDIIRIALSNTASNIDDINDVMMDDEEDLLKIGDDHVPELNDVEIAALRAVFGDE